MCFKRTPAARSPADAPTSRPVEWVGLAAVCLRVCCVCVCVRVPYVFRSALTRILRRTCTGTCTRIDAHTSAAHISRQLSLPGPSLAARVTAPSIRHVYHTEYCASQAKRTRLAVIDYSCAGVCRRHVYDRYNPHSWKPRKRFGARGNVWQWFN